MGALTDIVESLDGKISMLQLKLEKLQQLRNELEQQLEKAAVHIGRQQQEINELKKQNETLRLANSLLGSDENKRETKLKINSLIREIDYCIAQLSE